MGFHKGVVVKVNVNQRYATTATTHAVLKEVAERAKVSLALLRTRIFDDLLPDAGRMVDGGHYDLVVEYSNYQCFIGMPNSIREENWQ